MPGALLLALNGDRDVAALECRFDLLATLADDDHTLVCAEPIHRVEQVQEQRPAGDRMQHFVRVGTHARALPRGKDHDGETALVGHCGEQWHGALMSASLVQMKRAAPDGAALTLPQTFALEDVHIIFVADEAHLLDVRSLGDGQHLVDRLVASGRVRLEVELRDRVHLLRRIEI